MKLPLHHLFTDVTKYIPPLWSLFILFIIYLLNQIDRYLLPIQADVMQRDVHDLTDSRLGILTGIGFTVIYTISGLIVGFLADHVIPKRRTLILFTALIFWSCMTGITAFSTEFWHLLLTRIGLAIGEAASSPLSYSLLSDLFQEKYRSLVMSLYSFGIYCGYASAFVTAAVIPEWRWSFAILGCLGLVVAFVFVVSVWEPRRDRMTTRANRKEENRPIADSTTIGHELQSENEEAQLLEQISTLEPPKRGSFFSALCGRLHCCCRSGRRHGSISIAFKQRMREILDRRKWIFMLRRSSFWLICLAAGVRNFVGYSQAAWLPAFYTRVHDQSQQQQAQWFSWIPAVFGVLSALCGGILGDFLTKRFHSHRGKIFVCIGSNLCAIPFVLLVLLLPNVTLSYLSMIAVYLSAECWAGNASALISLVVPREMRTFMMSVYFLILSLIGGLGPYIVGFINEQQSEKRDTVKWSLLVSMVSGFVLSSGIFAVALLGLNSDVKAVKLWEEDSEYWGIRAREEGDV